MNSHRYNTFMITFLQENYPKVFEEANRHFISDLEEIHKVTNNFCSYHQLEIKDLQHVRVGRYLKLRYKYIACVLYIFQPSKLVGEGRLNKELATKFKEIFEIDSSQLKRLITQATNLYLYKEFKTDVMHFCNTYKLLK